MIQGGMLSIHLDGKHAYGVYQRQKHATQNMTYIKIAYRCLARKSSIAW